MVAKCSDVSINLKSQFYMAKLTYFLTLVGYSSEFSQSILSGISGMFGLDLSLVDQYSAVNTEPYISCNKQTSPHSWVTHCFLPQIPFEGYHTGGNLLRTS